MENSKNSKWFGRLSSNEIEISNIPRILEPPCDDLFQVLRPILVIGKCTGLFPFQDLFSINPEVLPTCKKRNWSSLVSVCMIVAHAIQSTILLVVSVKLLWQEDKKDIHGSIEKLHYPSLALGHFCIAWMYWSFLVHGDKFCLIFSNWRRQCDKIHFISQKDQNLKLKVCSLLVVVMVSGILENLVNSIRFLPTPSTLLNQTNVGQPNTYATNQSEEMTINMTVLEVYYRGENGNVANFVPYNIFIFMLTFALHKISVYNLNLICILISSMAYILGQKFKYFVQEISAKLHLCNQGRFPTLEYATSTAMSNNNGKFLEAIQVGIKNERTDISGIDWSLVRQDYLILCQLVQQIDNFISPFIFFNVGFFVQWTCITIYTGLTVPRLTLLDQIYALWALGHLIARILILVLTASEIVEQTKYFHSVLQNCSRKEYCREVKRLELLVSRPVGLTGLRCFTLTRSFVLSLVHVIFTFEIVMLQASGGNKSINGFKN